MEYWIENTLNLKAFEEFEKELEMKDTQLQSIEIYEKGRKIVHWAVFPYSCKDKREVYSLSKSFTSTAIGIASDKKMLSVEDSLTKYYSQYIKKPVDKKWEKVKIKHLLSMTVGHKNCAMPQMAFADDSIKAFFETPLEYEPGTKFVYNTGASCVLADIIYQVSGLTVLDFLQKELFEIMEIQDVRWDTCRDGRCQGGTGLKVSCEDVAKLGLLYCQNGKWNGRQLLSTEWVKMASAKQIDNKDNGTPDWCAGYGFQFWNNHTEGFRGDGAYGQLCVILPKQQIVVSMMTESGNMSAELNAVWNLLSKIHQSQAGKGLKSEYSVITQEDGISVNTGWMKCGKNPMGLQMMKIKSTQDTVEILMSDGKISQTLSAKKNQWTENQMVLYGFYPLLYRQMPRNCNQCDRLMVGLRKNGSEICLECRMTTAPHIFYWKFEYQENKCVSEIVSMADVFGKEKKWTAENFEVSI